jgi:hypothetical protein
MSEHYQFQFFRFDMVRLKEAGKGPGGARPGSVYQDRTLLPDQVTGVDAGMKRQNLKGHEQ